MTSLQLILVDIKLPSYMYKKYLNLSIDSGV